MKIPEFRPAVKSDFPTIKDDEIFEVVSGVQKTVKDLVRMSDKAIGTDNLNEIILEVDLEPDTWTELEVMNLKGTPQGAQPILVDYSAGTVTGWGVQLIDQQHIRVKVQLTSDDDDIDVPDKVTTRIWVKGA